MMSAADLEARATTLRTVEEVEAFLREHADCALFKAGSCHLTASALDTIAPVLDLNPSLPLGLIRVVESRPASQRLAELTGVRHASPQILLIRDGRVVHARDNWDISSAALREALAEFFDSDQRALP
jgi:bacillithiol system protein YtxJ